MRASDQLDTASNTVARTERAAVHRPTRNAQLATLVDLARKLFGPTMTFLWLWSCHAIAAGGLFADEREGKTGTSMGKEKKKMPRMSAAP
jgi:hypothetical protein